MYAINEELLKSEYKGVDSHLIISNPKYQREINQKRVNAILMNFDERLVNPPKVSYRDGKYYVFDGQTTLTVLKIRNKGFDLIVPCKVYYDLTEAEEAWLFEQQFGIVGRVEIADKLRSRYNRGEEKAVAIVNLAKQAGFIVDFNTSKMNKRIVALGTLNNVFNRYGAGVYKETLSIIYDAWNGTNDSVREEIIDGMAIFCATYFGRYNRALLVEKLQHINPIVIVREGKASIERGAAKYAKQIQNIYNKRLRHRLEDE